MPCCPSSSPNSTSGYSSAHTPSSQLPNQDIRMVCSAQKSPCLNHKLPTTTFATKPISNCVNTVRHSVPPSINNIATPTATFTFKAPMGTVVLPNCSTATALLSSKVSEHQKIHPVLVVPSPSNRSVDGPQAGVLLNLVPPIRVPQYTPPMPRTLVPHTSQKTQLTNNCIHPMVAPVSTTPNAISFSEQPPRIPATPSPVISNEKHHTAHTPTVPEKIANKIDQKKKDFMMSLGLVTTDSLFDLKNKKMERKRRSTANPQFSNAALEEKWRNAAAAQALGPPQKRPRGRPRLESKTNGIGSEPTSPVASAVMNGVHKSEENVEQMLSGLCLVCTQPGDLVKCDTCAKQQHLDCMQPPLLVRPDVPWRCADCRALPLSCDIAAKEDDKRKLLKKSLELRLKRSQLEGKLQHLTELAGQQKSRQSELEASLKGTTSLLERFHSVVHGVQLYS